MSTGPEAEALSGLLERERELGALGRAVEDCQQGRGGGLVIEGPAGIGKSSLLAHARERAAAAGIRVVWARGAELEREFPYGVVRQFFESFLFTVPPEERRRWLRGTAELAGKLFSSDAAERAQPAEDFALLHSLYWMCANIAEERPLMMVLDDAQWADTPSLNFVEFSLRRLEQLPFTFLVATRLPDERSPAPLVALVAEPSTTLLRPAPLSVPAVDRLVREQIDPAADGAFARACHEVTSGNPFLLRELLHEVREEQLPATAHAADRVRAIGPRGVARVVLLRLARLPESARRLAAALSVVADDVSLGDLAELAGLDEPTTVGAAAGAQAAEILELRGGVRFAHPVVRSAVYEDLPAVERTQLHLRAAQLKAARERPAAEIAGHLLHVEPGDDPWVIRTLREAARRASAAGDYRGAERLLSRALLERGADAERPGLLAELGSAQARTGNPSGAGHLREAADAARDPVRSAAISIELATVLKFSLQADQAAEVLLEAIRRLHLPPGELARRLQAELLGTRFISPVAHERIRAELRSLDVPSGEPQDLLDSFLLAGAAYDTVAALGPAAEAIELGRRALSGTGVPADPVLGGQALIVASVALIWAEDFDFVYERCTRALADAQAARSAVAVGNTSTIRSMCGYRSGRLLEAEADAATVLELAPEAEGLKTLLPPAVATAVLAGIERGVDLAALGTLAFNLDLDRATHLFPYTQLSWARGELCLATEQWSRARAHFADCDRADPGYGAANPSMVPWREGAALAELRLGDHAAARERSGDALRRARNFGAPRAIGMSLRACALVSDGPRRVAGLREAVETLAAAGAPLELARASCDLGAALRAAGERTEARAVLARAHELAGSIGATRIAGRAAEELTAAGVRPRREPGIGLGSLTPSERRVAEMAAGGKTNREIAQSLFVTEKTVETHLGHVYDKLGVRSRRRLPELLGLTTAG